MNPQSRVKLEVIETAPERAVTRLHRLVRQREILRASFRDAWNRFAEGAPDAELDVWAEASLELANVNAGPACLIAFWRASVELAADVGLAALATVGRAAADICRHAGAQAALAALQTIGPALRGLPNPGDLALWARGLVRLAREAPESVVAVASRTERILASCDGAGFEAFIAAGLKAAGKDRAKRRAFFTLEDPLAQHILERSGGTPTFSESERSLKAFATALWGKPPVLRGAGPTRHAAMPRRTSIIGGLIRVPEVFRGVPPDMARLLFRACVAHASAHLALTPARFPVGTLKPLQIALIGLIEDARVEALAMRRFPGLRRLWSPFHVAQPTGVTTAPALLARLARALFDTTYVDDNGFVMKARELFGAEEARLEDPSLSRRVGGLLGNDLGQMRVQFNPRTYAIEPLYRDDGLGLFDFGEDSSAAADMTELFVDAARIEQQEQPSPPDRSQDGEPPDEEPAGRARPVAADETGVVVATYPEWDRAAGIDRPDWTTVRDVPPALGDTGGLERALDEVPAVRSRIRRLVRGARIGRHVRLKRQPEGPELDLDATIEAAIARRAGNIPDTRVYRTTERRTRDLAVTILIDASESTRDRTGTGGATVLDVERLAVAALAEALAALGDPFALRAFASAGREHVHFVRIKDFGEPYGLTAKARLAGLAPGLSTRLGAVLRHAGAEMAAVHSFRKLILVLTDGEPSDVDVSDPLDLVADARRATQVLKSRGIDVFGVTLDPTGIGSGAAVFGRNQNMPVRRLDDLPARLAELYFRLARR